MNAIQKTRFYLFMSLVARVASVAGYGIGILFVLLDLGVFIFARFAFDSSIIWGAAVMIAGGWVEGWCAKTLVKRYGMSA